MTTALLILHFCVTIALIGVVLIQRSEGGGLGIGSSQGMGAFMSGRGTANLLTRTTAVLAGLFMFLSLALAVLYKGAVTGAGHDILATPPQQSAPVVPALPAGSTPAPAASTPAAPAPAASAPSGPAPSVAPAQAPSKP
ncbi:preprotein translocase subunit SecG [Acetobacter sp. TBRC 12305]|uniref:Protein-export membrane protein SecG n=1 Tax=Acetobacter garciniae TaxID=2817435 RepID=A0A939HNG9_9PROT|nr:preprotein translocase subunit SecG [Acetobacter garciniae]MBO1324214.1 preprotein translocase subunit SecG [Acetobacter garciniae]MBX0343903.1 preprotein translocase subunit SecG [Acetobacter garciniae]